MKAMRRAPAVLIVVALAGCSQATSPADQRLEFPAIIQEVSEVPASPGAIGWLLVAHPERGYPADLSVVHVLEDTRVKRKSSGGSIAAIGLSAIEIGEIGRFQIDDVELRSYPRQVFATSIVVGVLD
jgi:hypothetical protein